jgi:hypothetical protein
LRVFKTKWFARFARREGIADSKLLATLREIEKGLIDADYGGGLIKKRVARDGGGKSGGYRSIIAYRSEEKCIFMFCFAKSDKGNLNINEVAQYKNATGIYQEAVALSMIRLQIWLFGPYFSSFSTNSYGYYSQTSQNLVSNIQIFASARIARQPLRVQ